MISLLGWRWFQEQSLQTTTELGLPDVLYMLHLVPDHLLGGKGEGAGEGLNDSAELQALLMTSLR